MLNFNTVVINITKIFVFINTMVTCVDPGLINKVPNSVSLSGKVTDSVPLSGRISVKFFLDW